MTASRAFGLASVLLLLISACASSAPTDNGSAAPIEAAPFTTIVEVRSPDGQLRIELGLDQGDRLRYRVVRSIDGTPVLVIEDSTLGVETSVGSFTTAQALEMVGETRVVTDTLDLPHGKATNTNIEARTTTVRADDLLIDLWVADTGAALRYRLDRPGETFTIEWERTSFSVPSASRAWLQQHDPPTRWGPAYERLWSRESTAGSPGRSASGWTMPALFATEQSWTMLTEADLGDGAAASHFSPAATDGEFLLDFAARGEGNAIGDPRPVAVDTWTSPWRVILNSSSVGDIVESSIVRHVSPPADDGADYEWVRAGRVSWSWWSDHESSRDPDAIEPFIDLAAEMQWEYSLVDANWDDPTIFGFDRLRDLAAYAGERNVGLFVWYNSGGPNNAVTEAPRDRMAERATRRQEFANLADAGIAGVKVDFFHSDKPDIIQLYRDILSDAAEFELMVNFHGATLPRGWGREFPNLLTIEAVRGAEAYRFDPNYNRVAPRQNTVLPFTRNVVGPMDYTPVILGDEVIRQTTNGHELALTVVFESALLHFVDTPEAYLAQPEVVLDLLRTVPAAWQETRFIAGQPESFAVIARRNGEQWWIGAITADDPQSIRIDLGELGVDPSVSLVAVCDDPEWRRADAGTYLDPTQYAIRSTEAGDALVLELPVNGGCLVRLGE